MRNARTWRLYPTVSRSCVTPTIMLRLRVFRSGIRQYIGKYSVLSRMVGICTRQGRHYDRHGNKAVSVTWPKTMMHLQLCPLCTTSCTLADLSAVISNAQRVAEHWSNLIRCNHATWYKKKKWLSFALLHFKISQYISSCRDLQSGWQVMTAAYKLLRHEVHRFWTVLCLPY